MCIFFFFNDTATTEIYTLSLHDALPISAVVSGFCQLLRPCVPTSKVSRSTRPFHLTDILRQAAFLDRKSTRLNSSHANISYAVFCLKKKTKSISPHQ